MNSAGKSLVGELNNQTLLLGFLLLTHGFWCAVNDTEANKVIVSIIGSVMIILQIFAIKVKEEIEKIARES